MIEASRIVKIREQDAVEVAFSISFQEKEGWFLSGGKAYRSFTSMVDNIIFDEDRKTVLTDYIAKFSKIEYLKKEVEKERSLWGETFSEIDWMSAKRAVNMDSKVQKEGLFFTATHSFTIKQLKVNKGDRLYFIYNSRQKEAGCLVLKKDSRPEELLPKNDFLLPMWNQGPASTVSYRAGLTSNAILKLKGKPLYTDLFKESLATSVILGLTNHYSVPYRSYPSFMRIVAENLKMLENDEFTINGEPALEQFGTYYNQLSLESQEECLPETVRIFVEKGKMFPKHLKDAVLEQEKPEEQIPDLVKKMRVLVNAVFEISSSKDGIIFIERSTEEKAVVPHGTGHKGTIKVKKILKKYPLLMRQLGSTSVVNINKALRIVVAERDSELTRKSTHSIQVGKGELWMDYGRGLLTSTFEKTPKDIIALLEWDKRVKYAQASNRLNGIRHYFSGKRGIDDFFITCLSMQVCVVLDIPFSLSAGAMNKAAIVKLIKLLNAPTFNPLRLHFAYFDEKENRQLPRSKTLVLVGSSSEGPYQINAVSRKKEVDILFLEEPSEEVPGYTFYQTTKVKPLKALSSIVGETLSYIASAYRNEVHVKNELSDFQTIKRLVSRFASPLVAARNESL